MTIEIKRDWKRTGRPPGPAKPYRCHHCEKPALYRVGHYNTCREHRHFLVAIRKAGNVKHYEEKQAATEAWKKEQSDLAARPRIKKRGRHQEWRP